MLSVAIFGERMGFLNFTNEADTGRCLCRSHLHFSYKGLSRLINGSTHASGVKWTVNSNVFVLLYYEAKGRIEKTVTCFYIY